MNNEYVIARKSADAIRPANTHSTICELTAPHDCIKKWFKTWNGFSVTALVRTLVEQELFQTIARSVVGVDCMIQPMRLL